MQRLVPRGTKARYRSAAALALLVAVIAGFWTFGSTAASAHHPIPDLHAQCADAGGWAVGFDVKSWNNTMAGGGGNERIEVAYQIDGGAWTALSWQSTYKFTVANGFKFSGHFQIPAGDAAKVRLKAWAGTSWSNGQNQTEAQESDWEKLPKDCGPEPTTTTKAPTTTAAPTTTTTTAATSTTKATTTTTKAPTTTSKAPTTTVAVSPTTVVESTTTTTAAVAPVAPTTTVAVKGISTSPLPITGSNTFGLVAFAAALLTGGFLLVRAARAES